jgi:hypothetical protein
MEAINELTIDSPAIEAPEAPAPEEGAATRDIRPASSGIVNIKQEIMRLADHGLYAIPVNISTRANGKKKPSFLGGDWRSFKAIDYWKAHIHDCLRSWSNGLAILTGPSDLFCLDVDVQSSRDMKSGELKRAGTELWDKLVAEHGEPATLKVVTGSGGFHLYFSPSGTIGLNRTNNFAWLRVDGALYGVDGRGVGGLLFAPPSQYKGKRGETKSYSWAPGGDGVPQPMPAWLVCVINACSLGASSPVAAQLSDGLSTPQPFANADAGVPSSSLASGDARAERVEEDAVPTHLGLLVHEMKVMLREKANDSTSAYASALPHGLHGTYYCFPTQGPRVCFFGRKHSGSNNFNLLKRGRNVFYCCHGDQCSDEPVRKLGKLTLEAALKDATIDPVSSEEQIDIFKKYLEQGRSAFLNFVAEVARTGGGQPFEGLAKIFSLIYQTEGRILNTGEKKIILFWDGRG